MPLGEDDLKTIDERIQENLTKAFGAPEGKTLAEHLEEQGAERTNQILNAYDKRTSKSRSALEQQLKEIQETLGALKEGGGQGGEGGEEGGEGGDLSKLPEPVRKQIEALTRKSADLEKKLEDERKARETEAEERKKIEEQSAARAMRDETQRIALSKEIGVDPERVEVMLDHLTGREMIRAREGGGYEFLKGKDKYTQEPLWVPLDEGLKEFVKGSGKMFLPAVPGTGGGDKPPGAPPGPQGRQLTDSEIDNLKPSEIEALAADGRIQLG